MDNISDKISEILADPKKLEQIKGLAGMMGLGDSPGMPKHEEEKPADTGIDPSMMSTMMKIAPLLQSAQSDDDGARLLRSLKPFLRDERKSRIDGAVRMLQLMKILPLLKNTL